MHFLMRRLFKKLPGCYPSGSKLFGKPDFGRMKFIVRQLKQRDERRKVETQRFIWYVFVNGSIFGEMLPLSLNFPMNGNFFQLNIS